MMDALVLIPLGYLMYSRRRTILSFVGHYLTKFYSLFHAHVARIGNGASAGQVNVKATPNQAKYSQCVLLVMAELTC